MKQLYDIVKLTENKQLIEYILETAPLGVAMLDEGGFFKEVNRKFARALGYAPEELAGVHHCEISSPLFSKKDDYKYLQLIRREITSFFTFKQYYKRNGDSINFRVDVMAQYSEESDSLQILAFYKQSTPFYSKYLPVLSSSFFPILEEALDPGIMLVGNDGKILFASANASKYLGFTEHECIEMSFDSIVDKKNIIKLVTILYDVGANSKFEYKLSFKRDDGSSINIVADIIVDDSNYYKQGTILIIVFKKRIETPKSTGNQQWENYEKRLFSEIDSIKAMLSTISGKYPEKYKKDINSAFTSYGLTRREQEVLTNFINRKSIKETAYEMNLSEITIRKYFSRLYRKFGVSGKDELLLILHQENYL